MFKMVSQSGAAIRYTNSFRKREQLLKLGYTEEKAKTPRKKNVKKEKNNEKENSDRTKKGL